MQIIERRMERANPGDFWNYYFLGDVHLGHIGCHIKKLRDDIKVIRRDDRARVFLMGDIFDSVAVTDKRFSFSSVDPAMLVRRVPGAIINAQVEAGVEIFKPLFDDGLVEAVITGNHEETLLYRASHDPLLSLCDRVGYKGYVGAYTAFVRHIYPGRANGKNTKNWVLDISLHHGNGGGKYSGAKVNAVERRGDWITSADIVANGHVHKRLATEKALLVMPRHKNLTVDEKTQTCVLTGSYLRGYHVGGGSQYVERGDYPPCSLGGMVVNAMLHTDENGRQFIKHRGFPL